MVSKFFFLLALAFTPLLARAGTADDERITNEYVRTLLSGARPALIPGLLGPRRSRLLLDAVEKTRAGGHAVDPEGVIPGFAWPSLPPREMARWFRLGGIARESDLIEHLAGAPAEPGLLYELLGIEARLRTAGARALLARLAEELPQELRDFRSLAPRAFQPPAAAEVRGLFNDLPDVAHFQDGAYAGKPRLFLFCRHDRSYACLLALKDKDDKPVRTGAALWTQPGLALSGYGKPYNEPLGNTPQGVHLVNGVMPEANDTYSFGKFRRMILEFPPASAGETEMRRLLPAAAQGSPWWKESAIARDVGRGELRIHGTGQHNDRPDVIFYPFIATIGCVAQREMEYGGVDYVDQRKLLDQLMRAQGLEPKFANETAIRALLYVIDIDDKKAAVTPADLARLGIN